MIYTPSTVAVVVFVAFVGFTMWLSFYLARSAKSSAGYFAAHGEIPWFINGVAFAGDYLSAASFLGICGMIAFYGYDGFLYSIGFLAGWIVALFVVAEPMKRLGKFTFADALNARFNSPGITLVVGISTLVVSVFYLIPQMVGAGALIQPLLGFEHWQGVLIVGVTVVIIVTTAGMVSTTWVQFLKGGLLVIFSAVLTVMILNRGFEVKQGGSDGYEFRDYGPYLVSEVYAATGTHELGSALAGRDEFADAKWLDSPDGDAFEPRFLKSSSGLWALEYRRSDAGTEVMLREAQTVEELDDGTFLVNGKPKGTKTGEPELHPVGYVSKLPGDATTTGPLGPLEFFRTLQDSEVIIWKKQAVKDLPGVDVYVSTPTAGSKVLRPGENPKFAGIRSDNVLDKLNFLSLMLALFCGTASLPHILIRYYTVKDEAAARKSTIVGIGAIGFFYVLTLYLGLGAMTSGALDVTDSNMAAPLLAKSMNEWLFAIISAIAFTTVLGTVSGLILASSGAVVHDLMKNWLRMDISDHEQVRLAKITTVVIGVIAIALGILFKDLNVAGLVGWAFSIAASANLPALVMLLFWRGTTRQGVIAAVLVGMVSSLGWILLSGPTLSSVFGFKGHPGYVPFSEPGIVTIPLGFATLVLVSLMTKTDAADVDGIANAPV
ncbi:MAG: cation acetate symporter [Planctomycetaceae bacterium]